MTKSHVQHTVDVSSRHTCVFTVSNTPADDCVSAGDDDYIYDDNDDDDSLITSTSAWRPTAAPSREYDNNRSADINSPRLGNGSATVNTT